ncbi:hypothetical protein [Asanoa hainanensis]|uniref:hypothetical protein n=1 Tax=Asanoa hainanensis TaxID=560556 RepID=UPI00117C18E8|nr:hypothetical protein [Asanoa hainanensis]
MIRSYLDEWTVLDPANPERESPANTVWFGIPPGPVDADLVSQALVDVGAGLRARHGGDDGTATFYAWYDEQAGQLRCSMRSTGPDALPFGGRFEVVLDPSPVVALIAADPHPGVVAWSDLEPATAGDTAPEHVFPVFVSVIRPVRGRSSRA